MALDHVRAGSTWELRLLPNLGKSETYGELPTSRGMPTLLGGTKANVPHFSFCTVERNENEEQLFS